MGVDRGSFVLKAEKILEDEMVVSAICETDENKIENVRKLLNPETKIYKDFDSFIKSGIDAVVLCNYFHEHCEYAIKALDAGVAVLSETTAAASLGDCVDLVEAVERNNGKYMLAANCPYFKPVSAMIEKIKSGEYGRVVYADAEYIHPPEPGHRKVIDKNNLHWRDTLPVCYYNMHSLGPLMYITNTLPKKVIGKAVSMPNPASGRLRDAAKTFTLTEMDDGAVFNTTGVVNVGTHSRRYGFGAKQLYCASLQRHAHELFTLLLWGRCYGKPIHFVCNA